jgi:hypothetical protein
VNLQAATWKMTMAGKENDRGHNKVLALEQSGTSLKGTLTDEGGTLTLSGKLDGSSVTLTGKRAA